MNADTAEEPIQTEFREGILTLRFNRPEKKNALNIAMYAALATALERSDDDRAVRVILLTGTEGCFSSGYDLTEFLNAPPSGGESPVMRFLGSLSRAKKPVVAAVSGAAVGIGATMLLHCDLVYAGADALFQMPFVNLGLCPEAGSTLLLPRMMGYQRAAELLLLGEPFSADTARELGIVNAVCPEEELLETARDAAGRLAAQPPAAVRLAKELLKRGYASALQETIAVEGEHFSARLGSPEATEALRAFVERRRPDFKRFS
jgi:enoyl-CoA hydratase/carnithine racemase